MFALLWCEMQNAAGLYGSATKHKPEGWTDIILTQSVELEMTYCFALLLLVVTGSMKLCLPYAVCLCAC